MGELTDFWKQMDAKVSAQKELLAKTESEVKRAFTRGYAWRFVKDRGDGKWRANHRHHGTVEEKSAEALLARIERLCQADKASGKK